MKDGSLLAIGAAGAAALAAALASRGSRAVERPFIHYDEVVRGPLERISAMGNELLARGVPKAEVDRLIQEAMARGLAATERRTFKFVHAFQASGEQVFVVGPRLQEMFVQTSLAKVPRDMIRLPYPGYYVALPSAPWRMWSRMHGYSEIRGIYVMARDYGMDLLLFGPVRPSADSSAMNEAYVPLDVNAAYAAGLDLEDYLVESLSRSIQARMVELPTEALGHIVETHLNALRVVINAALYVNASGAELTADPDRIAQRRRAILEEELRRTGKPKKRRLLERERAKLSGATVTWLGRRIEDAAAAEATRAPGRKMRQHWVRGHWKMPFRRAGGPQLRWVQPYERGVEEERITRRQYRFDEPPPEEE
jgi:hypothetical protein